MFNMFMKDSDDEDEDEWFYGSIKRYKQLRMFEVENVIRQIELSDARNICVVGEDRLGRHKILELSLPDKITVTACQEGLVKNIDLKMRSGCYTPAPVTQMKTLWNQKKIIVSLEEQANVSLYNLGSEESDLISRETTLKCDLVSPFVAVNDKELILLTAKDKGDVVVMDIHENRALHKKTITENEADVQLDPAFVSENLAALCNRYTGRITLQDIRMDEPSATISQGVGSRPEELWTMATNEDNKMKTTGNDSKLGLVSTLGKLLLYDLRNTQTPSCNCNLNICRNKKHVPRFNFSPDSSDVVSVTGFDDNVYVFSICGSEQLRTVFIHDGHKHHNGCIGDSFVTCHIWYRDKTILSASCNSSLQCWQFIPEAL